MDDGHAIQEAIRTAHDRIAREYAAYDRGGYDPLSLIGWTRDVVVRNIACLLARYAPPADRLTVLDAGCGNGAWSEIYALRLGLSRLIGADFAGEMLAAAATRARRAGYADRLRLVHTPLERMEGVADESVDVVHFFGVVEHVDDPAPILAEFARVLRPGGVVIFDVPRRGSLSHLTFLAFGLSPSRWGTETTWRDRLRAREKMRYYRYRSPRQMARLARAAGLAVVTRRPNSYIWVVGLPMYAFYLAQKYLRRRVVQFYEALDRVVRVTWPIPSGELMLLRKPLPGKPSAISGQPSAADR